MPMTSSEVDGVEYVPMTASHVDECAFVFARAFGYEPMTMCLGLPWVSWLGFGYLYSRKAAADGMSRVAVDMESGKIIGFVWSEDMVTEEPPELADVLPPRSTDILDVAEACSEPYTKGKKADGAVPGEVFHMWCLGVAPEGRKRGLASRLLRMNMVDARELGYKEAYAECTGAFSKRCCIKEGFEEVHRVVYKDWKKHPTSNSEETTGGASDEHADDRRRIFRAASLARAVSREVLVAHEACVCLVLHL